MRQGDRVSGDRPRAERLTNERVQAFLLDGEASPVNVVFMVADFADPPSLKRQGLFPCEAEIARRLSQSGKRWREIARQLEREGLPKIDPVMRGRFWPAVDAFFRARHGLGNVVPSDPDGEEHWNAA